MSSRTSTIQGAAGFTLVEIILVSAISLILASMFFLNVTRQNVVFELDEAAYSLTAVLRDASERARGQDGGTAWGVYFVNPAGAPDYHALFSGSTFTAANSTVYLPPKVEFSDPGSGANKEVVFAKVTGLPGAATAVTIQVIDSPSDSRTITINANGSISY